MKSKIKKILLIIIASSILAIASTKCIFFGLTKKYTNTKITEKRAVIKKEILKKYNAQEVILNTKDNIKIKGLLILKPNSTKTFLICHGFRQAKESYRPLIEIFNESNIFLFDLRAHGESEGDRVSFGPDEAQDITTAYDFLKTNPQTANTQIYPIGFSMGASALIRAAYNGCDFKALILDSGFACIDIINADTLINISKAKKPFSQIIKIFEPILNLTKYFISWLEYNKLDTYKLISEVDIPVLLIHCKDDKTIQAFSSEILLKHAKNIKKELWIVNNNKHLNAHKIFPEEYKKKILDFIN